MATEVRRRFDDVPLLPEGAVDLGQLLPGAGEIELDVGFGKGGFVLSRALGDPGRRVLGIEVRKKYVALVRDRLLVAQAQVEDLPIITSDPAIGRYDVDVIW